MNQKKTAKTLKSNEGFSLVELIIVIAIMVALVAMLAPQFVKYVEKSRDAVVTTAAQDVLSIAKTEYTMGHLTFTGDEGTISVQTDANGSLMAVMSDNMTYDDQEGNSGNDAFELMCGIDKAKHSASTKAYVIRITKDNSITQSEGGIFTEEVEEDGGHSDTPAGELTP